MKTLLLTTLTILAVNSTTHAQLFNDAAITNDANLMSDYSNQWYNNATGSYTGKNAAIFEHYGPSSNTFVNNGSYTYGTGGMSDKFLGPNGAAGTQEIGGSSAPLFYDLVLNNGSTATIAITNSSGVQVGNSLTFSNGITTTVRSNAAIGALKFNGSATWSGTMGATRHVNGYVYKTGNTSFTFPVGDGTQYRPLAYTTPLASSTDQLAIAYISGDPGNNLDPTGGAHSRTAISSAGVTGTTKIVSVSNIGFWDWVPVAGTSVIDFTVSIPDMTANYVTASNMRVVGWNVNTSQWENLSGATGASSLAAGTVMSATVINMANYSAIGIGSVTQAPLPLRLISFAGTTSGCSVQLAWQTATETGTSSFSIERSANAADWAAIGSMPALGNSTTVHTYTLKDESPLRAANYYRLRMEDLDGSTTYSNIIRITPECGQQAGITISPNPFSESLQIEGMAPGTTIKIISADGKLAYSGTADDKATVQTGSWPAGMYTVQVTRGTKEVRTLQVVKK